MKKTRNGKSKVVFSRESLSEYRRALIVEELLLENGHKVEGYSGKVIYACQEKSEAVGEFLLGEGGFAPGPLDEIAALEAVRALANTARGRELGLYAKGNSLYTQDNQVVCSLVRFSWEAHWKGHPQLPLHVREGLTRLPIPVPV